MLKYVMVCGAVASAMAGILHAQQLPWPLASPADLFGRTQCTEVPVVVTGASPMERRLVCSAAHGVLETLGHCRITPRRTIQVEVSAEVRQSLGGPNFVLFDTNQDKVRVTRFARISALAKGTPYTELPQDEFYSSLIAHEVVHAVMHHNLKRPAASLAAYEYPAYALQIASLSPSTRQQFLRHFGEVAVGPDALFNNALLHFDPFFFAVRAYQHYAASANGCAHLSALLEGSVAFIPTLDQSR
jgi:hypothetical protein